MSIMAVLEEKYPQRATKLTSQTDIPRGKYMVYILTIEDKPIVVGHGKHNRAKVIFDDKKQITSGHIKALFVRVYRLFGKNNFQRFIIECNDKAEAKDIEANLHHAIGGNSRELPDDIKNALFKDIPVDSIQYMVLRMALSSSFDGLADLNLWKREGILSDAIWKIVGDRLELDDPSK